MQEDEDGFTGLMNLGYRNENQKIKESLSLFSFDKRVALLGSQGVTGFTAIHTAISNSNIEGIKALLDSIKEDKEACKYIVYSIRDFRGGNDLSWVRYCHEQYGAPQMEDLLRSYIPDLSAEEEAEVTRQYNDRVRNKEQRGKGKSLGIHMRQGPVGSSRVTRPGMVTEVQHQNVIKIEMLPISRIPDRESVRTYAAEARERMNAEVQHQDVQGIEIPEPERWCAIM